MSVRNRLEKRFRFDNEATQYLKSLNYDLPLAADMPPKCTAGNRQQLYLALGFGGDIYGIPHPDGWPWPDARGPAEWPWRETPDGKRYLIRPPHHESPEAPMPAQARFNI